MIAGLVNVTAGVESSDLVFVSAQTAIRLSVVALKSSAESRYSVPLLAVFQLVRGRRRRRLERVGRSFRQRNRRALDRLILERAGHQRQLVDRVDLGAVELRAEGRELVRRDVDAVLVGPEQRLVAEARTTGMARQRSARPVIGDRAVVGVVDRTVRGRF
jgi:hypothetical protein